MCVWIGGRGGTKTTNCWWSDSEAFQTKSSANRGCGAQCCCIGSANQGCVAQCCCIGSANRGCVAQCCCIGSANQGCGAQCCCIASTWALAHTESRKNTTGLSLGQGSGGQEVRRSGGRGGRHPVAPTCHKSMFGSYCYNA